MPSPSPADKNPVPYFWRVRLKALELRGFKSFADPVQLPLQHRLIVIIGPNGSGKSNIADALRWIIGEQKLSHLRIEKSDNLIFNGSARRKPLPYAEVSLIVQDFSPELPQLTFTRRVHRSGDMEYLLNDRPARLKDFLQYFWQMGLSPHSILDGGQVEALIQDRGGARRTLLESLAGIERYHHQRRELLAEIERTRQSLAGVEQLIAQLTQQIALLSQQAARVEKYQALKAEYQALLSQYIQGEVAYYWQRFARSTDEEAALARSLETLEAEMERLRGGLREDRRAPVAEALERTRAAREEVGKRLQQLARTESRLTERIAQLTTQLNSLDQETNHRQRQEKELEQMEAENRLHLEALARKRAELAASLQALQQEVEAQKASQRTFQEAHRALLAQIEAIQQEKVRLSTEKSRWEARQAALQQEKQKIKAHFAHLAETLTACEAEVSRKAGELERLRQEVSEARALCDKLEKTRAGLEEKLAALRQTLTSLQAEQRSLLSERTTLESLLWEAAHWPPALRRLIQAHPDRLVPLESVFYAEEADLPLLAMLLRLEPLTLCVRGEDLIPQVEKALSQEKEGLFRVIEVEGLSSSPKSDAPPLPEAQSFATRLRALPGFEKLAQTLWGDVWKVSEPVTPPAGYRFLHAEKQLLLTPVGTYYFSGAPKTAHIGLPHRIQGLRETEAVLQGQIEELQAQVADQKATLEALPLKAAAQALEKAHQALLETEKAHARLEARLTEVRKARNAEEARLQTLESEEAQHQQGLAPLQAALNEAESRLSAHQAELGELSGQSEALQKALQGLLAQQTEKRHQLIQTEERLRQEERHQRLLHQQLGDVRKRLLYLQDQKQRLHQELTEARADLARTQQELQQARAEADLLTARQKAQEDELRATEAALRELESRLMALQTEREAFVERRNTLQKRIQEAEHHIHLLAQRLEMETGLKLAELEGVQAPRLPPEETERRLQTLRTEMSSIGELNFEAFSTLQSEKARMQALKAQKEDIESALRRLEQLLLHLDREAARRFTETFEAVRAAFVQRFREIFSEEDTCDLILIEPEKPLSSPVEIIARPRGKRPLSLMQLSGGEKALTVLAMLMGILSIHPPLLTILDEVDATLDDTNADKFGQLLRRFSEASQLIVITHNKITMSYAEVLYGVTMPEPGVSAVLGVELLQALKEMSAA